MRKDTLNYAVDCVLFIVFVFLASTGLVMEFAAPHGAGGRFGPLGLGRHDWSHFHSALAYFFIGAMLLHIVLHWRWIIVRTEGAENRRTKLRLAAFWLGIALIFGLAAVPFIAPVTAVPGGGMGRGNPLHEGR